MPRHRALFSRIMENGKTRPRPDIHAISPGFTTRRTGILPEHDVAEKKKRERENGERHGTAPITGVVAIATVRDPGESAPDAHLLEAVLQRPPRHAEPFRGMTAVIPARLEGLENLFILKTRVSDDERARPVRTADAPLFTR